MLECLDKLLELTDKLTKDTFAATERMQAALDNTQNCDIIKA